MKPWMLWSRHYHAVYIVLMELRNWLKLFNVIFCLIEQTIFRIDCGGILFPGTFSSVYLASLKDCPEEKFALKHLVPTSSSSRIENELRCLKMMGYVYMSPVTTLQVVGFHCPANMCWSTVFLSLCSGRDNVISIHTCVRHRDHIVLIMPYFPHDRFAVSASLIPSPPTEGLGLGIPSPLAEGLGWGWQPCSSNSISRAHSDLQ